MHRHSTTHDVLVVGAGPAGLATAITLARNGVDVLVIDKHAGTSPFPKATGVSTRTMELLRTWGVEEQVRADAMRVQPMLSVAATLTAAPMFAMSFGYPSDEQALRVSPTTPCCVAQDHLEPVLLDHLRSRGGTVRFRTELADLAVASDGVTAELVDLASKTRYRVHARYVVGADGPRSVVRSALGVEVDDLGSLGDFVAITFRADITHRMPGGASALNLVSAPGAEGLFVPTDAHDRWVFAVEVKPGDDDPARWSADRVTALLCAGTGIDDLEPEIVAVLPFAMGGHVARSFRAGRGFVVGDAAHRTTPVGGIGLNIAIQSAHNLGWKLAWVIRGWAADALLDSYEAERRPVGRAAVARSLRREPDPGFDGLGWEMGTHYDSAVMASRPGTGRRAPHSWVDHAGRRLSTLDLYDGRLTALVGHRADKWRRDAARLAGEGLPITALVVSSEVAGDDLAATYEVGPEDAVLVRPDGFIAWRGNAIDADVESIGAVVRLALGHHAEGQADTVAVAS